MKILLAIAVTLILCQQFQHSATAEDRADTEIPAIHVEALGVPATLREVSRQTHLAIGLEMNVIMGKESKIDFDFSGGTVADLANKCVSLLHGASWKILKGSGIVISQHGKASLLAGVQIEYPGIANASRQQVWSDLSNRPEIKEWLQGENCRRLALLRGHEWQGDAPTVSIQKETISLEQLLATAASSSNSRYWSILQNSREGACEIIITLW